MPLELSRHGQRSVIDLRHRVDQHLNAGAGFDALLPTDADGMHARL